MAKRKARPLVPPGKAPPTGKTPVTSLKLARKLTSRFHTLLNEERALQAASSPAAGATAGTDVERLKQVRIQLAALGGRETYQDASALATKAFKSSRFVFKTLVGAGLQPAACPVATGGTGGIAFHNPLRVLEVGAVNGQLKACPWMRTRAIDITSRDKRVIEEIDFFAVPVADALRGEFDVVVCAMVLNCVPDLHARTLMLMRMHDHLRPGGIAFLALPSRCLHMSEFITLPMFVHVLLAAGFCIISQHATPKISFLVCQRVDAVWEGGDASAVTARFMAGTGRAVHTTCVRRCAPVWEALLQAADGEGLSRAGHAHAGDKRRCSSGAAGDDNDAGEAAVDAYLATLRDRMHASARACTLGMHAVPVGQVAEVRETLDRLATRSRLPPHLLPVTGFTLTDFAMCIRPEWRTAHDDAATGGATRALNRGSATRKKARRVGDEET